MYFLLSPAKSLNETQAIPLDLNEYYQQPKLIEYSCQLMAELKQKGPIELTELMKVSDKIAQLNAERNQNWAWNEDKPFSITDKNNPAKPAVYLFDGDVYTGLDVYHMDKQQVTYLNQHLAILSGLYGLLNSLDLILPYRLEMGTKLVNHQGDNLYQFWQEKITEQVINNMQATKTNSLINLASNEYFKAVKKPLLKQANIEIITPKFEDEKNGKFKVISFYAKKARGLMVKYACDNQLTDIEQLKAFNLAGYYYCDDLSNNTDWVFRRNEK